MAFWLCEERRDQESAPMMRFDPRYWTVNFPRPMMASVISTDADALRVDAIFYHADELCGLIWDSEDSIDHPLLAYETNRDYRGLTVSFHWKSHGLKKLDAVHGPTLTIEGRDAKGDDKTWFVRLWNYASGGPEDAQITLDFDNMEGGFLLPAESDPVYAGDIDRMFISLVAPGYDQTHTAFASGEEGWAEITAIHCDGAGVMLEKGDVMLPEHGLKMATGYDDSFNQTPERLLGNIRALGYRQLINHYVGMSHYFQLEPLGDAHYVSLAGSALNTPCQHWHLDFADRARVMGYEMIFSLSYELFNAHCWNDWKQRAENGDPALTGWVPPSTLLSPANNAAMNYLQAIARGFVHILKQARQPVKFQVGEPWWWIMTDGRICLYDAAATAAFGALSVSIADIKGPKSPAQNAMLDRAGELLAESTDALVEAARQEAGAAAFESLILVYLPTVLDPEAPEAKRANVPTGWAKPAFDILQLEDYDWVISGNHGATDNAFALMHDRLNYPITQQHYLSGFVLRPEERAQWQDIEKATERSIARGTPETFIWAEPQVSRDGFTHFEIGEVDMQPFDDVSFPLELGREASAIAEFSTNIVTTASGFESRNSDWADARQSYDVGPGIRDERELGILIDFFRARRGAAKAFRFTDPFDHSSAGMTDAPTGTDQLLGTGDGIRTEFQLIKRYGAGDEAQERLITRPAAESVIISVDGIPSAEWTIADGGKIIFDTAPASGAVVTAGFLFDIPVRFASDRLEVGYASFRAGEIPSVPLVEIREAV